MAELTDKLIKFLLLGLFFLAIGSFAVLIGKPYGYSSAYMLTDQVSTIGIEQTLNDTNEQSTEWKEAFESSNPLFQVVGVAVESLFTIGKNMGTAIFGIFNIYLITMTNLIGFPPIVIATLTTILIVGLIVAIYLFFKEGR